MIAKQASDKTLASRDSRINITKRDLDLLMRLSRWTLTISLPPTINLRKSSARFTSLSLTIQVSTTSVRSLDLEVRPSRNSKKKASVVFQSGEMEPRTDLKFTTRMSGMKSPSTS
jgi:hypothetical protein